MLRYRKYSRLSERKRQTYQLVSASEEEKLKNDKQRKRDDFDITKYSEINTKGSSCDVDKDSMYIDTEVDEGTIDDNTDDKAIMEDSLTYQLWEDEETISILEDRRQGRHIGIAYYF